MSEKHGHIGGVHAVRQALDNERITALLVAENKQSKNILALIELAQDKGIKVEKVPFYHLDILVPGVKHQGVVVAYQAQQQAPMNWQQAIAGKDKPLLLILDSIQDPHNLGACLRSALGAGVDAVLIPNAKAAAITPTVHKVSSGAAEVLPIFSVANLRREMETMQQQGIWIVGGAGEEAQSLYDTDLTPPLAIVVGNEGEGLRYGVRKQCDYLVAIPLDERMESLNVSVACGIMLFEARRQRHHL